MGDGTPALAFVGILPSRIVAHSFLRVNCRWCVRRQLLYSEDTGQMRCALMSELFLRCP